MVSRASIVKRYLGIVLRNIHSKQFWKRWLIACAVVDRDLRESAQLSLPTLPETGSPLEPEPLLKGWIRISPVQGPGLLGLVEQVVMARIVVERRPSAMFEIGTYLGATTLLLAANSPPYASVYTLDLSPTKGEVPDTKFPVTAKTIRSGSPRVGELFRDSEHSHKITQLFGDSATYDFSPYFGQMDLVFVDGNHQYDNVKADSYNALKLIGPEGMIIWHDYETQYGAGVVRCLNELGQSLPLYRIPGTRFVIYDKRRVDCEA